MDNQQASPVGLPTQEQSQEKQYREVMEKMSQILVKMKENNEPAVLHPKLEDDASIITHVNFLPEGGILTYLQRYEKPFRGFPYSDIVQNIDEFKKLIKIILQKFSANYKGASLWSKAKLLFSIDLMKTLAVGYLHAYHWQIKRNRLKPHMYCKCVREIHTVLSNRCLDILYKDDFREAIRDSVCLFLEFDNAYRFRVQDILPEMDKEAMLANPTKELSRLLDLLISREIAEPGKVKMAEKWKMAKELICLFLRFNRDIANKIALILTRINLLEIDLTDEDRYYCEFRKDYKFGFMTRGAIPIREIPKGQPIEQSNEQPKELPIVPINSFPQDIVSEIMEVVPPDKRNNVIPINTLPPQLIKKIQDYSQKKEPPIVESTIKTQ